MTSHDRAVTVTLSQSPQSVRRGYAAACHRDLGGGGSVPRLRIVSLRPATDSECVASSHCSGCRGAGAAGPAPIHSSDSPKPRTPSPGPWQAAGSLSEERSRRRGSRRGHGGRRRRRSRGVRNPSQADPGPAAPGAGGPRPGPVTARKSAARRTRRRRPRFHSHESPSRRPARAGGGSVPRCHSVPGHRVTGTVVPRGSEWCQCQ